MKILLVHGRYRSTAPSGENHVVDQEAAALTHAGHVVTRFERHSDDIAQWSLARKAALPAQTLYNPATRRDIAEQLREDRPDVVHVHNTFPLITPSVLHACRDEGIPVVVTLHNYKLLCASGELFRDGKICHSCLDGRSQPAVRHGCYRGSTLATLPVVAGMHINRGSWQRLVSAYIFISAAQRELMRGLDLPVERVFVKHNFVPSPQPQASTREHRITYLGRLDTAKGVPFLMHAWDAFVAERPATTLRLSIAGGGPLAEDVRAWAAAHPSVDAHGLLPRPDAATLLSRSLAAVVPSAWEETFGLVAVEAMAAGVAPIAPDHGAFPELISDGKDGVIYHPGDGPALVEVFRDVDDHPGKYAALGLAANRGYQARFTREINIEELLEIYRYAIRNPVTTRSADVLSNG
jgi:glycosyltransferase involved in cell wall biosynthesis